MKTKGWIGVDLDGTLAEYHGWISEKHIGDPIPEMAERVHRWLADGEDVRIFTARVDGGNVAIAMGNPAGEAFRDVGQIRAIIQDWTEKHFGVRLPVTNQKDYGMIELWDDRAVRVVINTGHPCCEQSDRIAALESDLQSCRDDYAAHVAMVARKERPAYDEQQRRINALEAELDAWKKWERAVKAEIDKKDQLIKQMNFALSHQVPKYSIS